MTARQSAERADALQADYSVRVLTAERAEVLVEAASHAARRSQWFFDEVSRSHRATATSDRSWNAAAKRSRIPGITFPTLRVYHQGPAIQEFSSGPLGLGQRTFRVIEQNVYGSLVAKGIVLAAGIAGLASLSVAVAADAITAILVVMNGLRLFGAGHPTIAAAAPVKSNVAAPQVK